MRKMAVLILSVFAVIGLTATTVGAAARPHTIGQPTVTIDGSGNLSVQWKVAGLGNFTSAAFLTADRVEAVHGCDNPGVGGSGIHIPPGQPVVTEGVTGPTTNIPPSNGQITFTVGIPAPPPPNATSFCPGSNWNVVLVSITYVNVVLHIQQNGVDVLTASLDTISKTLYP